MPSETGVPLGVAGVSTQENSPTSILLPCPMKVRGKVLGP